MPYKGSYVWNIRQKIGHDVLIIPSADTLAVDKSGRLLLVFNKDFHHWASPGGYAEEAQTSSECAARELLEEAGLEARPEDLVPFAFMSGHTATYSSGDITRPFTQCFTTTIWKDAGDELDTEEISERKWFTLDEISELALSTTMAKVIEAYKRFLATNQYQIIDGRDQQSV